MSLRNIGAKQKNSKEILTKPVQQHSKGKVRWFKTVKTIRVIYDINRKKKDKKFYDAHKCYKRKKAHTPKNPMLFLMKTLNKLGSKGNHLNIIKTIYENENPMGNIAINGKGLKNLLFRSVRS